MPPRLSTVFLLVSLATGPILADPVHRALVIETDGKVEWGPTNGTEPPPLQAWAPLRDGDTFFLADGAKISLLCSDGSCARLDASFVVGPGICVDAPSCLDAQGPSSSPTDEGRRILGEWVVAEGGWQLSGHARGPQERWGHDPILISPRCPPGALGDCQGWLEDPQELVFLTVADADRYLFSLTGRYEPESVPAERLERCRPWPAFAGSLVCRHPWPSSWKLPDSGRPVNLTFRVEVGDELRVAKHRESLYRMASQDSLDFEEVRGDAGDLLRFLVFRASGEDALLFASLIGRDALPPVLVLKLAQLYLRRDFPRPAEKLFRGLVGQATTPQLLAEVNLGLAHTAYELGDLEKARRQLHRSKLTFERLGLETRRAEMETLDRRICSASEVDQR